jgi:hypothetical protein
LKGEATRGLTGLGTANTYHAPTRRSGSETMVKANNAMNFSAGEIERFRDEWDGFRWHEAQVVLNRV